MTVDINHILDRVDEVMADAPPGPWTARKSGDDDEPWRLYVPGRLVGEVTEDALATVFSITPWVKDLAARVRELEAAHRKIIALGRIGEANEISRRALGEPTE